MTKTIADTFCPANTAEWRAWLKHNHSSKESVWLIFYKKSSPKFNLSWSDAVDQALCFGWIDSTKKSLDSEKFIQYFSKRKAQSTWSRVNKEKVDNLIKEGLMTKAGLKRIEIAKENGSWYILDEVEKLIIPDDLGKEFKNRPGSEDFFQSLPKSTKRGCLHWVVMAKRAETRKKRILEIAKNAERKQLPKLFR